VRQILEFDGKLYSLPLLKKAAYKFSESVATIFSEKEGNLVCDFSLPDDFTDLQVTAFLDNFKKEVLDQDLRELIRAETETTRNLILAHAFSKAELEGDE